MKTHGLTGWALACAAAMVCGGAFAAGANDARIKELQKAISDNVTSYGCWNWYYGRKYMEGLPKGWTDEKLDKMVAQYIADCLELEKLQPDNFFAPYWAARAYEVRGDYAEAADAYARALKLKTNDSYAVADALYNKASCEFGLGKRDECLETLKDLAARKINTGRRNMADPSANGAMARYFMGEHGMADRLDLPVWTGAKPYPTPREAKYTETFVPLTEVAIKVSGIDADDARVTLLARKLKKFGIAAEVKGLLGGLFSSAPYTVEIAVRDDAPVAEKEGYALEIGEKSAKIDARDTQGALWGVVSFLQCCDRAKKSVRMCAIRDWPETAKRGYLISFWMDSVEFSLFNKANSVTMQNGPTWGCYLDPLSRWLELEMAREYGRYGLELYIGIAWATMYPVLPNSQPRTLELEISRAMDYASAGAGLYFPYDDGRYCGGDAKTGLHPHDAEKFGKGANCDADHVNAIFRAVRAKYPDFKLIFCPPFYWGPDSKSAYPENREDYLRSLRKLDPEIELYWTGPMVKSFDKKPYQVKWFTELTGHKPTIFQNGVGAHNLVGYTVDTVPITRWHYPEFYKDIAGFHHNATMPPIDSSRSATQCDGLWNPAAFDEVESIRRGLNQLCGEKAYDLLAPGLPALAYFDKYKWGRVTSDILKEDVKDLEAKVALAKKCWADAMAYNPKIAWWGQYNAGIGAAESALRGAKNPPDFLKQYEKQIKATEEVAKQEVGYDKAKGDILFTPIDLFGSATTGEYSDVRKKNVPRRFVRIMRGDATNLNTLSLGFTCDPFPPAGDYEILIRGLDDEAKAENDLEIAINNKTVANQVIAKGKLGFSDEEYRTVSVRIPFKSMARNNSISIRNVTPGTNQNGTPWFMVNYVVIRKAAK